jgi:hypothetical protein
MFDRLRNSKEERLVITHELWVLDCGLRVLRLRCAGHYPPDLTGAACADKIYEVGTEAFLAEKANAVFLDFAELDYSRGDELFQAFEIPRHLSIGRDDCPTAARTGPKCQEGLQILISNHCGDWREANLLFPDEKSALDQLARRNYIEGFIELTSTLRFYSKWRTIRELLTARGVAPTEVILLSYDHAGDHDMGMTLAVSDGRIIEVILREDLRLQLYTSIVGWEVDVPTDGETYLACRILKDEEWSVRFAAEVEAFYHSKNK